MSDYIIKTVNHDCLRKRWAEVEMAVRRSFVDSNFNDKFTVERPLWHIREGMKGALGDRIRHVLAFSTEEKILAGAFCIPTCRDGDEVSCDIGWFFSSGELPGIRRIKILDKVFETVHQEVRHAGFKYIVTNMGTMEGAKYLSKRHGYFHQPQGEKTNRWLKTLQL